MENLFTKTNAIGKYGEKIVADYYKAKGDTVIDVSNDKEYQKQDIDLIINGQTVEIKTTNNFPIYKDFCLELVSNDTPERYKEGWFRTSQAEVVIFYSPKDKTMYQIRLDALRQYFKEHENEIETRRCYFREYGDIIKPCVLAFVPEADIELNISAYRKITIEE